MKKIIYIVIIIFLLVIKISSQQKKFNLINSADLVTKDKFGYTKWSNIVDRGKLFYVYEKYGNNPFKKFDNNILFYKLKNLEKIIIEVPVEKFLKDNKNLLIDEMLYEEVSGKRRKNYMITNCYFYDTENKAAGLELENTVYRGKDKLSRKYFLYWDLKTNKITKSVLLYNTVHKKIKEKGSNTYYNFRKIGYNYETGIYYGLLTKMILHSEYYKDNGKRKLKKTQTENMKCDFYAFDLNNRKLITTISIGKGVHVFYCKKLNICFFTAYDVLNSHTEIKNPTGFIVNLENGNVKKINTEMWTYWAEFDTEKKLLYHISSSTGKLISTNIESGMKQGELYLGDAGDNEYRKFGFIEDDILLYYIHGNMIFINKNNMKITRKINIKQINENITSSSPAFILPDMKGMVIEGRNSKNKTTGLLYYFEYK